MKKSITLSIPCIVGIPAIAQAHSGHDHVWNAISHHAIEGSLLAAGVALVVVLATRVRKNTRNSND